MKHMTGCVVMIAVVAIIVIAGRAGDAPSWLPFLLVLCCPLMMIGTMIMMGRGKSDQSEHDTHPLQHH